MPPSNANELIQFLNRRPAVICKFPSGERERRIFLGARENKLQWLQPESGGNRSTPLTDSTKFDNGGFTVSQEGFTFRFDYETLTLLREMAADEAFELYDHGGIPQEVGPWVSDGDIMRRKFSMSEGGSQLVFVVRFESGDSCVINAYTEV